MPTLSSKSVIDLSESRMQCAWLEKSHQFKFDKVLTFMASAPAARGSRKSLSIAQFASFHSKNTQNKKN